MGYSQAVDSLEIFLQRQPLVANQNPLRPRTDGQHRPVFGILQIDARCDERAVKARSKIGLRMESDPLRPARGQTYLEISMLRAVAEKCPPLCIHFVLPGPIDKLAQVVSNNFSTWTVVQAAGRMIGIHVDGRIIGNQDSDIQVLKESGVGFKHPRLPFLATDRLGPAQRTEP